MKLDRVIAVRNCKTVYRDGDRCVKVFNSEYSRSDVLSEALNQSRVEESGLCVPKVLEVTKIDERWAIVSEYIKGYTLSQLIKEDPKRKREYIKLLVSLQSDMHKRCCSLLPGMKDSILRKISSAKLDLRTKKRLLGEAKGMRELDVICHGDLTPSNIIISDKDIPYVIDWSHATRGDPAADAAYTYAAFIANRDIIGADIYLDLITGSGSVTLFGIGKWMTPCAAAKITECNEDKRKALTEFIKGQR